MLCRVVNNRACEDTAISSGHPTVDCTIAEANTAVPHPGASPDAVRKPSSSCSKTTTRHAAKRAMDTR